ncbi:MAG TPA: phospholipase D-like domain-containing protein [Urbifossiella sp.]|nr:phospholipase D-like domain-containing protein [Urbifossiella sp.]
MSIELLYHDPNEPGGVSRFDTALLAIARSGNLSLACPYIGLTYLQRMIYQSGSWRLLTDLQEWIRSQSQVQRDRIRHLLGQNRDKIRNVPGLHAKVALGSSMALLGSANFTNEGIRRRTEVAIRIENEPQVDELAKWFECLWDRAYQLTDTRLRRVAAYVARLRPEPVSDNPSPAEIDSPISSSYASLSPLVTAQLQGQITAAEEDYYVNYGYGENWREWTDARDIGFVSAGGGRRYYSGPLDQLSVGNRIWVYAPGHGYLGVARVSRASQPANQFRVKHGGRQQEIMNVVSACEGYHYDNIDDLDMCEYFVAVEWLDRIEDIGERLCYGSQYFSSRSTVCQPRDRRWPRTLRCLQERFPNYNH